MNFPKDMPDGCPPADAADVQGVIFRVVGQCPPTGYDLQTHAELGKARSAVGEKACWRFGLSVFKRFEEAAHQRELFPALGSQISMATLNSTHGKVKATGKPPHQTWWPYEGVERASLFSCVDSAPVT